MTNDSRFDSRDSEVQQEPWVENSPVRVPTPSPLRASNTLETLKPKEINVEAIKGMFEASGWQNPPELIKDVRKTDNPENAGPPFVQNRTNGPVDVIKDGKKYTVVVNPPANVMPVDWTAASFTLPSLLDRVIKLEEQVDSLLDRIAKFNFKASHKL